MIKQIFPLLTSKVIKQQNFQVCYPAAQWTAGRTSSSSRICSCRAIFDNLELQLALYLCFEPTIEDLIARPMSISNATLHEFILMRLKQVTLIFSKSLKKKKTGKKPLG